MDRKIVIVTGANSGIGRAASIRFAGAGYRVVMACRDLERNKKARQEIIELSQNGNVDLLKLDVSSFQSIKDFCVQFEEEYGKLDILINNAGHFRHGEKTYRLSPEKIELSFATNVFGPFLLTCLLKGCLKRSEDARVLNACSTNIRHFFEPKREIEFDNLRGEFQDTRPYNSYKMYGDSKMALLMLTFRMAEELKEEKIKINAVQIPAIKLSRETMAKFGSVWRIAARIQNFFSASPETMADTYFHICTSEEFRSVTGKLINDRREVMESSPYSGGLLQDMKQLKDQGVYPKYADDKNNIDRVWDLAVELTEMWM